MTISRWVNAKKASISRVFQAQRICTDPDTVTTTVLRPASTGNGTMVALRARSWQQVAEFHAAALARGGRGDH